MVTHICLSRFSATTAQFTDWKFSTCTCSTSTGACRISGKVFTLIKYTYIGLWSWTLHCSSRLSTYVCTFMYYLLLHCSLRLLSFVLHHRGWLTDREFWWTALTRFLSEKNKQLHSYYNFTQIYTSWNIRIFDLPVHSYLSCNRILHKYWVWIPYYYNQCKA